MLSVAGKSIEYMPKNVKKSAKQVVSEPPSTRVLPVIHTSAEVRTWLDHYWAKLTLPPHELQRLAITQDRQEFARWTGRRLNPLALGCYCYLPGTHGESLPQVSMAHTAGDRQLAGEHPATLQLSLFSQDVVSVVAPKPLTTPRHRHLIFIEPDLLALGTEVTVAHELIHLADRVHGRPRRHHCHGYDAIAADEAAITGRDPELLRQLLRDETTRREAVLRATNPYRYLYMCPHCGKEYPRVRRYPRPVSCGACDRSYNPTYLLVLQSTSPGAELELETVI